MPTKIIVRQTPVWQKGGALGATAPATWPDTALMVHTKDAASPEGIKRTIVDVMDDATTLGLPEIAWADIIRWRPLNQV